MKKQIHNFLLENEFSIISSNNEARPANITNIPAVQPVSFFWNDNKLQTCFNIRRYLFFMSWVWHSKYYLGIIILLFRSLLKPLKTCIQPIRLSKPCMFMNIIVVKCASMNKRLSWTSAYMLYKRTIECCVVTFRIAWIVTFIVHIIYSSMHVQKDLKQRMQLLMVIK